jgi:gliding motility-associated-like protein
LKTPVRIYIFILLSFSWLSAKSQTQISGTINNYAKVTATNDTDNVTVNNPAGFKTGDTVLIIQMKGAEYDLGVNALITMNYTGRYEFIAVQSVVGNTIKFRSNFLNTYDNPPQALQIVRVPSYQKATVTSPLTCDPWNGNTGGVLAFFVLDTLNLQADISVSGKGFLGGGSTSGSSVCYANTSIRHFLITATDSAGLKGEGIEAVPFAWARGKGAIGNAGGGGNGFGAGGGGGSGYNAGGSGGQASASKCTGSGTWGGEGGSSAQAYFAGNNSETRDRIFMGGGGGSSRGTNAGDATSGGNGGGIIFMIATNLKSNGYYLRSNGIDAATAVNDGGGGGGGGGGTVIVALNNAIDPLNVEVKGGKGGSSDCTGRGGGGGGGFLWFADQTLPFNSVAVTAGNAGGYTLTTCSLSITPGVNGNPGDSANYLNPVLNGFLFNLIYSDQTICYGLLPAKFTGTRPRGGNGNYAYQWQYRNKLTSNAWSNIAGATSKDYQSPALYDTTDFRRVVTSIQINTGSPVADSSKWIRVKVRPEIKGLSIAPADTAMCYGQNPINIRGALASGGDGSPLAYLWEESLDNNTWNKVSVPPSNQQNYASTSNQITKYYRRDVSNSTCSVTSNTAHITVLPVIGGNSLQPDSTICMGTSPNPMRGINTLTGGDNIYRYQWLKNTTDSMHWAITGAKDTFATYNPGILNDTIFYKRIVYSGLRNTCTDTSKRVKITVLNPVGTNTITQDQTICQSTSPLRFMGSLPSGGDNAYRYQWEMSNDNATWTSLQSPPKPDSVNYKYGIISTTIPNYFRRTVFSGVYNCCKNSSASIKITVQPKIQNNVIADTAEICYGQAPPGLAQKSGTVSGGDNTTYAYLWQKKLMNGAWRDSSGTNQTSFQPGTLYQTTYFRRKVSSGVCVDYSDSLKINVLDTINGNSKPDGAFEVCEDTMPEIFAGPQVTGGQTGVYRYYWQNSTDGVTWDSIANAHGKNYQSPALNRNTYFRRIVKSGYNNCCISYGDTFLIKVSKHPSLPVAGNPQKLTFQFDTKLHAKPVTIGWGKWSTKNQAVNIVSPKDTATEVSNLSFGNNIFYWTTANGSCPTVTDSVLVDVDNIRRFNGFSPNNDGTNDQFVIEGAMNSKVRKLHVYDRWGAEVYSSDNYQNDWEGTAKNGQPLPEDTYYYVFEADGNRIYKGFVVIKR